MQHAELYCGRRHMQEYAKGDGAMKEYKNGTFYEGLPLEFFLGGIRCRALRISFETYRQPIPSHSHSSNGWELHMVAGGKGRVTLNGRSCSVGAGSFFVTGPHVEHSHISDPLEPISEYCVYLKIEPLKPLGGKTRHIPAFLQLFLETPCWLGPDPQSLLPVMEQLLGELGCRKTGYLTQCVSLLRQLLVLAARCYEASEPARSCSLPSEELPFPEQNYSLIEELFLYGYRDLTLEELASQLGLSPRQTERLLYAQYGKTFRQKKNEAKMSAALLLLEEDGRSITETALSLGYSSPEHFSAAFRRYFGLSPRSWKQRRARLPKEP